MAENENENAERYRLAVTRANAAPGDWWRHAPSLLHVLHLSLAATPQEELHQEARMIEGSVRTLD